MAIEKINGSNTDIVTNQPNNSIDDRTNPQPFPASSGTPYSSNTLATAYQFQSLESGYSSPSTPADEDARLARMQQQLGLSDTQVAQIKEISATAPRGSERFQEINSVLTSDQQQKLKTMHSHHHHVKPPLSDDEIDATVGNMTDELSLDDNQAVQIRQILQTTPPGPESQQAIESVLNADQLQAMQDLSSSQSSTGSLF